LFSGTSQGVRFEGVSPFRVNQRRSLGKKMR
jgi:hypothetical protein